MGGLLSELEGDYILGGLYRSQRGAYIMGGGAYNRS